MRAHGGECERADAGYSNAKYRGAGSQVGSALLDNCISPRHRALLQRWYRSELFCSLLVLVTLLLIVAVVHLLSYERAIRFELGAIDAFVGELADEHARARVLDLPVYFLNADEDAPQRRAIEERLARFFPPAMFRVPRIDGRLHLDDDRAHGGFESQTAEELGRTLSHLTAARQMVADGHEAALIVEDSAHFGLAPRWPFRLSELIAQLPSTWTTLQLYHTADVAYAPPAGDAPVGLTVVPYGGVHMSGTVAYVLSRRGADALMRCTRAGRAVHRKGLATRNGLTDTILYEFPHAEPWALWPRYIFGHPRFLGPSLHVGVRQALREARIAHGIVDHAQATWAATRPGPAPDDEDMPDEGDGAAMVVYSDVVSGEAL